MSTSERLLISISLSIVCLVQYGLCHGYQQPPNYNAQPQQQQYQQQPQQPQQAFGQPQVQQQATGQNGNLLHDSAKIHDRKHIGEHLHGAVNEQDLSKMTEEELQFHYFKMHDSDNNNKLDGSELIKSLIHWHGMCYLFVVYLHC